MVMNVYDQIIIGLSIKVVSMYVIVVLVVYLDSTYTRLS